MRASLQFRLWAASISHCQEQSACPLKFSSDEKKNVHCQDNSVLLFIDLGLADIFLSPLSTCWTEWEITLYLELSKALDIYSAQCSQLDQIRGTDYSEKEKSTCFYLKTMVYIMLKMPDPSQQDHHSSKPPTGQRHQPLSFISEPSTVAKQKNHLVNHSTGTDAAIRALNQQSHTAATARLTRGSWHKPPVVQPEKVDGSSAWPFHSLLRIKIKLFYGFYLIFLLGQPLCFNWGLLHLPLVYDARSALDWWTWIISPGLRLTQVEQI